MRKWFFFIPLGLLVFSPSVIHGQEEKSSSTPMVFEKSEKNSSTSDEKIYRFQSTTVWGELNVLVRDLRDHFRVEVKSGSPASGWILKEDKTGRTIAKDGLNSASQFQFKVNQSFQGFFRLTVFVTSDRDQVPVVIRFSADHEKQTENTGSENWEDFQENPDHPYNKMVKNLYEKALQDYSKNDIHAALEHLKKAEELDPTQSQVQSLSQKIQGSTEKPSSDPLEAARETLKAGNKEGALAKLDDYLDEHPDDSEGQELKHQIEGKNTTQSAIKNALAKARKAGQAGDTSQETKWYSKALKLDPKNEEAAKALGHLKESVSKPTPAKKQAKLSDTDTLAQADQTYNLGLDSYRKGDYPSAKKFWEQTLQLRPTNLQARRNLDRLAEEHPGLK